MGPRRRLVLSDAGSLAAPGASIGPGAAPIPATGSIVTYRAVHVHGGDLCAKAAEALRVNDLTGEMVDRVVSAMKWAAGED